MYARVAGGGEVGFFQWLGAHGPSFLDRTDAAVLGIDTCPLEGLEPAGYDEVLGLAGSGYATSVACAAGYRSAEDKYASVPKSRFPLDEIIEHR